MDAFIEIVKYTFPAALMLLLTYLLLSNFVDNEESKRRFYLKKDLQKKSLPMRFQAFERLTVFLERITPNHLVLRVKPGQLDAKAYAVLLTTNVRSEFDYNISQQVYISDETWRIIVSAKSQMISMINQAANSLEADATGFDLSRKLIELEMEVQLFPTKAALLKLKAEASRNF